MNHFFQKLNVSLLATALLLSPSFALAQNAFPFVEPTTSPVNSIAGSTSVGQVLGATTTINCDASVLNASGFYGQYFNLTRAQVFFGRPLPTNAVGGAPGWYASKNHTFNRIDKNLKFGDKFFPIQKTKADDPYFFAVHWRAAVYVPETGSYKFATTSDDESWVVIDDKVVTKVRKASGGPQRSVNTINLSAGVHEINVYFAERARSGSFMRMVDDSRLTYRPLPPGCSINDTPSTPPPPSTNDDNDDNTGNDNPPIILTDDNSATGTTSDNNTTGRVAGATNSRYTQAVALYRASGSPDVFAIYEDGQRHYISNPTSFAEYGYDFDDVKTVSRTTLNQYKDARLLRSPDNGTIYFLYTRPHRQWLKIAIPSPTAFVSYPGNYWGSVKTVTETDISAYANAELITANSIDIYLLKDGKKHRFISTETVTNLGYSLSEVVTVSEEHLNSYQASEPIG